MVRLAAFFLAFFLAVPADPLHASPSLARRAEFGLSIAPPAGAQPARIVRIRAGMAAERAGLAVDDRVLRVNGVEHREATAFLAAFRRFRTGDQLALQLDRQGRVIDVLLTAQPMRLEEHAGLEVKYGAAQSARGYAVRTITTRPLERRGKLPVLVFIPWLSCSPMETPYGPVDGWSHMLRDVMGKSGFAVVRVEKPGLADSGGPDCGATDLEHDMEAYRAGIRAALALDFVDPARLYLFGGSIGMSLAPVLALEFPVKGLVVSGGMARTWIEHIQDFERRRMQFAGRTPSEVNAAARRFADFYSRYLNGGLTPGQVISERPEMKDLWYDEPGHQFGRRAAYYQQLNRLDIEGAWSKLALPTLIVWGEYDWIMGREDQERVLAIVNARAPGLARLEVRPGMNHHFERFDSPQKAFNEEGGQYDAGAAAVIVEWLRQREP